MALHYEPLGLHSLMDAAAEITRKAKSHLAFALWVVPREKRKDLTTFYAFCRVVDDIADDSALSVGAKTERLARWSAVVRGETSPVDEMETCVREMLARRAIPVSFPVAIIEGCRSDIFPRRFSTWAELEDYIWHVAGAVGLVSVRLFGCTDPACDAYAVELAKGLQLTNILRDIREDHDNGGRLYLPEEALSKYNLTSRELIAGNGTAFSRFMNHMADRAECSFARASELLPASEKRRLLPARIMAGAYRTLLRNMRNDGFRIAEKRYRLSKPALCLILARHLVAQHLALE